MKFVISSSELLARLQSVSRAISSKSAIPVLDNFLFSLKENTLTITASDLETSLVARLEIENVEEEGEITVPAKLLLDSLKEQADIPLQFRTNSEGNSLEIIWANGDSMLPCTSGDDYPALATLSDESTSISVNSHALLEGINRSLYATADEELRPVMNGLFFDITTDALTIVASDAHKLVCYTRHDVKPGVDASFILPKKPASILRTLLGRVDQEVLLTFDKVNAYFRFEEFVLVCRLVEGNYPAYRAVIPKNNYNKLVINRLDFVNSLRRVSVCANQASSLIKLTLSNDQLLVSAQDLDFSIAAQERVACQYDGEEMEIGFKSTFLIEILSNLPYDEVSVELENASRAALILPAQESDPDEEILALIMPMMVNL